MQEEIKNGVNEESAAEHTEEVVSENAETTDAEKGNEKDKKKKVKKLEGELAAAKEALASAEDKYLRVLAEYDNFRKRTAKERDELYTNACNDVIKSLLPVLDSLDRASTMEGDGEQMRQGLQIIRKSFAEAFEKLGVTEMECLGQQFDPNLQNAVLHVDDEAYGESEIIEVLMKGYQKGDKIIRHPMVKVAN